MLPTLSDSSRRLRGTQSASIHRERGELPAEVPPRAVNNNSSSAQAAVNVTTKQHGNGPVSAALPALSDFARFFPPHASSLANFHSWNSGHAQPAVWSTSATGMLSPLAPPLRSLPWASPPAMAHGHPWTSAPTTVQDTPSSTQIHPDTESAPPLDHSRSPYATISLPLQLADSQRSIVHHPLISQRTTQSFMHSDVRTSPLMGIASAHNAIRLRQKSGEHRAHGSAENWHHQPATDPALESVVIRCTGFGDKPLVVFPARHALNFAVTVADVLNAVHRAIHLEHVSSNRYHGRRSSERQSRREAQSETACLDAHGAEHLGHGWLWGGLTPSQTERDVFFLLLY